MKQRTTSLVRHGLLLLSAAASTLAHAANPIVPGWYADPETRIFKGECWIYPT
jgi:hypothetical protein